MSFLIDTCALAELVKPRPHAGVLAWFNAQDAEALHLSALTVGEIEKGVALLPAGRRRTVLRTFPSPTPNALASNAVHLNVHLDRGGRACQNGIAVAAAMSLVASKAFKLA